MHSYSYRAEQHLPFYGNPGDATYFGVELEVQILPPSSLLQAARDTLDLLGRDFVILKEDGSIGSHTNIAGYEIVTAPATLQVHHALWNDFFENKPAGLVSWKTGECGMHVHISKPTPAHVAKLHYFLNSPAWRAQVVAIAGRQGGDYTSFTDPYTPIAPVDLYRYTLQANARGKLPGDAFTYADITHSLRTGGRYVALNTGNNATIEVRIFRGNASRSGFFKNLEFVHAAFYYTHLASMRDMTWGNFVHWVEDRHYDYPNLLAFLQHRFGGIVARIKLKNPELARVQRVEKKLLAHSTRPPMSSVSSSERISTLV